MISINKYYLYLATALLACFIFVGPKLYYVLAYERATGKLMGHKIVRYHSKNSRRTAVLPRIVFQAGKDEIEFYAPDFTKEVYGNTGTVPVLYNPDNPQQAFVNNFMGLWGKTLVYLGPVWAIWTICIFSAGFIPKTIRFNVKETEEKWFD
jgi:hypothetical protein